MVIGISGKIRSGKSRVAKSLCKILKKEGRQVKVKSFAQPLYEIVSKLYDVDIETIKKDKQKKKVVYLHTRGKGEEFKKSDYRTLLQTIGNTARDYGDPEIWINALFGTSNEKINGLDKIIHLLEKNTDKKLAREKNQKSGYYIARERKKNPHFLA